MKTRVAKFKDMSLRLFVLAMIVLPFSLSAQKNEHYNSPLYSPKYYDPAQSEPNGMPEALKAVGIEQKLGSQLPLDTELKDEDGKAVKLGNYFNTGRPVILALVYYECPMLCNQVLNGLTGSLKGCHLMQARNLTSLPLALTPARMTSPISQRTRKRAMSKGITAPDQRKAGIF